MPDLGNRANVMGPQPIAHRAEIPSEVIAAAQHILDLVARGDTAGMEALAIDRARADAVALAKASSGRDINDKDIAAIARTNKHYWIKARLGDASGAKPIVFQMRLGESDGRWMIWEAMNLTDTSPWTR